MLRSEDLRCGTQSQRPYQTRLIGKTLATRAFPNKVWVNAEEIETGVEAARLLLPPQKIRNRKNGFCYK